MTRSKSMNPEVRWEQDLDQDQELARVAQLQETLGDCMVGQVIDLEFDFEELLPVKQAVDRFMTYNYNLAPAFYVEPRFSKYSDQGITEFVPRVSRSGKNSAHGVFFGDIRFSEGAKLPVAVKPHVDDVAHTPVESALYDHLNTRAITELGFYSLQPVGVIIAGSDRAYSLTVLEETLTTLDSIDWSNFYPDIDENPGMRLIWSQIARQVALLHSKGAISHNDLAGRNMATTAENHAFIIDWELAHISLVKPRDAKISYYFCHPDLTYILETLCFPPQCKEGAGLGLFYKKPGDWWQGFQDIFYAEYESTRRDLAREESCKDLAETDSELEALTAALKYDMSRTREICLSIPPEHNQRA